MNTEKKENEQTCVYDGSVSEEQIKKWKQQHRKVIRIDVVDEDETHVGYFKRPSLEVMQAVTKIGKTDEMKGATTLFDGCWLGGSELLRQDSVLFIAATGQLNKAFAAAMGSLKNL